MSTYIYLYFVGTMVNTANSITSIVKPVWTLLGVRPNRGTRHTLLWAVAPAACWVLGTSPTAMKLGTVRIGTASTLRENKMLCLARKIEVQLDRLVRSSSTLEELTFKLQSTSNLKQILQMNTTWWKRSVGGAVYFLKNSSGLQELWHERPELRIENKLCSTTGYSGSLKIPGLPLRDEHC